jgi:hypothetical protein
MERRQSRRDLDLHVDRAGLDPLKGNVETRWTMPPLPLASR